VFWRCLCSYQDDGNTLLANIVYSVDDPVDYDAIVNQLAVSGAPAIVLVLYPEEVSKILDAASSHPVLGTDAVIWISVDSWSDLGLDGDTVTPEGVIGLTSYQANNSMTARYRHLWEQLDPEVYHDTDGDRSTFAAYSLHIIDAMASLAMAYQKAFNDNTGKSMDWQHTPCISDQCHMALCASLLQ
jgi:ABC-type branched-subunit amino acid transport system substrate-binding protein